MRKPRWALGPLTAKGLLLAGLVLLLVGLVQPCQAGTFFDDFNDGNANGWAFPYNSGMTQYPGGSWSVVDGVLKQSTSGDNNAGLVENLIFSNQEIEFRADTDSGYFGVALWYQQVDSTRANYIAISPQLVGYYGVFEFMDGTNKVTHYDIGGFEGGWFDMRVTADSATGTLEVYVDGVHLFTHVASTPYRSGLSGVYSGNAAGYFDNFRVTSDIPAIDIVPGSTENRINRKKPGTVSVAILSAENFDAPAQVSRTSLTFGPTGDEAPVTSCSKKARDVNGDGYPDLICSFSGSAAGFQAEDTEGWVKGRTIGGISFVSSDMVNIR